MITRLSINAIITTTIIVNMTVWSTFPLNINALAFTANQHRTTNCQHTLTTKVRTTNVSLFCQTTSMSWNQWQKAKNGRFLGKAMWKDFSEQLHSWQINMKNIEDDNTNAGATAQLCNSLSDDIVLAHSLSTFQCHLNHYLFQQSYQDVVL